MYVTHAHPAEAVGWTEMPFDRETRVVPSNTVFVLDRGHGKVRNIPFRWGQKPQLAASSHYFAVVLKSDSALFWLSLLKNCQNIFVIAKATWQNQGPDYKKILRLSYDVIITYDNRKSNLR